MSDLDKGQSQQSCPDQQQGMMIPMGKQTIWSLLDNLQIDQALTDHREIKEALLAKNPTQYIRARLVKSVAWVDNSIITLNDAKKHYPMQVDKIDEMIDSLLGIRSNSTEMIGMVDADKELDIKGVDITNPS